MNKDSNSRPIIKHKKEDFIKINKKIDPKNKKMNSGKLTFENKIKNRKKKDVIKNTFYRGPHRPTANSFFFDNNRSNYKENLPELKNFEQQGKKKNNEPFFNQDKFLEEQKNLSKISYNLFPKKKTNKTENLDHVQKQNNLKRKKLNLLNKLRKGLMKQGKQATANKIIKTCCSLIKFRDGVKPLDLIYESICNVKPLVELEKKSKTNFSKKKSRAVPIVPKRGFKLAVEWLIEGAKQRSERSISSSLYLEIINAHQKKGYAIKKKEDLHNLCKNTFYKSESLRPSNNKNNQK